MEYLEPLDVLWGSKFAYCEIILICGVLLSFSNWNETEERRKETKIWKKRETKWLPLRGVYFEGHFTEKGFCQTIF